jgi:prepilin-type N-terminal cleavage/methylation domain-containing protein
MKRAGFTLVEILVAMAIFLFGISAVLGLFQVGGGFEQDARARAELAPAVAPLVAALKAEAWGIGQDGASTLRERRGEDVPGARGYRYDLVVEAAGPTPALRRASVRFYRRSPDRVLARAGFLLPQRIPVDRLVEMEQRP